MHRRLGAVSKALELLVSDWLTLPDVAERLGESISHVRGLVDTRALIGVKRGDRSVFQVPDAFLIDSADGSGLMEVLPTLCGTAILLADQGFTDAETLEWLFTPDDALGTTPVEALRCGRRAEVRRIAQALN